jgi:hypothetical protein
MGLGRSGLGLRHAACLPHSSRLSLTKAQVIKIIKIFSCPEISGDLAPTLKIKYIPTIDLKEVSFFVTLDTYLFI